MPGDKDFLKKEKEPELFDYYDSRIIHDRDTSEPPADSYVNWVNGKRFIFKVKKGMRPDVKKVEDFELVYTTKEGVKDEIHLSEEYIKKHPAPAGSSFYRDFPGPQDIFD